jgi:hypothetical protein
MARITIQGSSDDLVEIGGDLAEEFSPQDTDDFMVVVSDGTVLNGSYDDNGVWRFTLHTSGTATMSKVEAPVDDDDNYSDVVTLEGELRWVGVATAVAKLSA